MSSFKIPKTDKIILEIDDVTTDRWREVRKYIYELKEKLSQLKVTLWCIPAFISYHFLDEIDDKNWIEWGLHGSSHWRGKDGDIKKVGGECDSWDSEKMYNYLSHNNYIYGRNKRFNYGFKAPWYYIKKETLEIIRSFPLWFAAVHPEWTEIPSGINIYDFTKYKGSVRLHIQDSHFDGFRENFELLSRSFSNETKFEFVSENVERSV